MIVPYNSDEKTNNESRTDAQSLDEKNDINGILDDSDKALLQYLVKMGKAISGDKINLEEVRDSVEALEHLKKAQEYEYMNALLRPERTRGAKLPSQMPIPSSSFQLKQSFYLNTNASGNACLLFNPYYLASGGSESTLFVNSDVTLTGTGTNNNFTAVNIGQTIPGVYNQYRLVSGSIVAKYIGRLDIVQGLIGGAVIFDQNIVPTTVGTLNPALQKYGDFNLAQDAFFWQEHFSLKGLRELYFPLDNKYEEYQNMGNSINGFGYLIYVSGAPPSTSAYKVDIYLNMECLPDVSFLNYIPTAISTTPTWGKEESIRAVQKNPIMAEDSYNKYGESEKKGNFWKKALSKFGTYLPNLVQLAGQVIPQLKGVSNAIIPVLSNNR